MKHLIWIALLLASVQVAQAQDVYTSSGKPGYHKRIKHEKGYDPAKLILGGSLNANYYGDGSSNFGITPIVGYHFTKDFAAGVGLGYQFNRVYDFSSPTQDFYDKESIIFPNIWGRYFVYRGLYATAQFEYDLIKYTSPFDQYGNPGGSTAINVTAPCLLAGIGVKQPLGGRVSLFIEVMYDVLQQPYSPYFGQPVFRGGICAGL